MRIGILVASVPIYPEGNLKTIEDDNALEKDYDKLYDTLTIVGLVGMITKKDS